MIIAQYTMHHGGAVATARYMMNWLTVTCATFIRVRTTSQRVLDTYLYQDMWHSIAKVCAGRMAWWHIYIYVHPKPEVQLTQHLDDENHRGESRWTLWKSNRRGYALATSTKSSEPLYGALKQVLGDKMLIRSGYMPSSILNRKPTEVSELPYGALMQELEKQILLMRMGNTSYCI